MKKLFSILFIAFTLVVNVKAEEIPSFVAPTSENTFSINLSYWKSAMVDVRIKDEFGNILVSEKLSTKDNKARAYNLKNLVDGNYTVEVEDNTRLVKQDVTLSDNLVTSSTTVKNIYKPNTKFVDGIFKINYLTLGHDVTVKIVNATGDVVFTQSYEQQAAINKAYDLNNLKKGSYNAIVISNDDVYSFDLVK